MLTQTKQQQLLKIFILSTIYGKGKLFMFYLIRPCNFFLSVRISYLLKNNLKPTLGKALSQFYDYSPPFLIKNDPQNQSEYFEKWEISREIRRVEELYKEQKSPTKIERH